MTTKSKEVAAKNQNTALAEVPEFLRQHMGDTRGSEEVGGGDLVVPRVELVQALSACRKKNDPAYIEGAQEGMLYNNVTREIFGENLHFIPVYFRKEYLLWRDQKLGGGFGGAYQNPEDADAALQGMEKPEEWEVVDTNQHFALVIKGDGSIDEAVISMAKTKAKASRTLNSLVRINGGPRFSRVYKLSGVSDQNSAGQEYYTYQVANVGFVDAGQFTRAEALYNMIQSGSIKVDRAVDGEALSDDDSEM